MKALDKYKSIIIPSILALLIAGCSSPPTHLILAPEIVNVPNHNYLNTQATLNVVDMRTSTHVVQILKEGKAATVLSSQQRLEKLITNVLTDAWQKQGVQFNQLSNTKINISIDKAINSVTQKTMTYTTQSEIIITVKIETPKQTLTNTFKTRGNSEGVLKADIAVLERDFNQNLNTLLTQIIKSEDVKAFL
jgi:uncharacterized lipoprotein